MTGILADGFANVKRAVQNNFADVYKQRVIDYLQGNRPNLQYEPCLE